MGLIRSQLGEIGVRCTREIPQVEARWRTLSLMQGCVRMGSTGHSNRCPQCAMARTRSKPGPPIATARDNLNKDHVQRMGHSLRLPAISPFTQSTTTSRLLPRLTLSCSPWLPRQLTSGCVDPLSGSPLFLNSPPLTPPAAQQGVCRDAEGAPSVRLGRARREEHLEL